MLLAADPKLLVEETLLVVLEVLGLRGLDIWPGEKASGVQSAWPRGVGGGA